MLSASLAFHRLYAENPADLRVKATLTLANATVLNLEGGDFMEGGFSFSTASSTESSFVIGAATVGSFDCILNNIEGKFDEYDFKGAEVVPYVGVELAPGNVEWLCKGRFWVEQPDSYGNTIGLSCVDNMTLLEKPYSDVGTQYPAPLQTIVNNICTTCGIVLATPDFPNKTYQVAERPDDGQLTCLQMVSYVAQLACSWACADANGRLAFRWYRTDWMDDERWLDGGTYDTVTTPYSDGDAADGGSFHSGGANMDGGSFDVVPSYALLQDIYDLTISTDDVVITGLKVTASGDDNNDGETVLYGADGYVLEVAGNPLVLLGRASTVAGLVGPSVVGMRFRPFRAQADVDPTIEAGDPVVFPDAKGVYYKSFATSCSWSVTGGSQVACNAETPARNSASTYSAVTAAIVANRKALRHEITAREAAVQDLQDILATSSGLYKTEQVQPDQSIIYYMHDQPTLAQSTIVWKFTSSAFAVSVDGGQTYPFGFDAWGNAILQTLYAIGIDADYITGGSINSRAGDSSWNLTTGEFNIGDITEPLLTCAQMTINANYVRSSESMYVPATRNAYYICFSSTSDDLLDLKVSLSGPNNFLSTTSAVPEYTGEVSDGVYRYVLRVVNRYEDRSFTGNVYVTGGSSANPRTITDICVYREPVSSDGVITIDTHPSNNKDSFKSELLGGYIAVSRNDYTTLIEPGIIVLDTQNSGKNDLAVAFTSRANLAYLCNEDCIVLRNGNVSSNRVGLTNDTFFIGATYFDDTGRWRDSSTISDVIEGTYGNFSVTEATIRRRGKMVKVMVKGTTTQAIYAYGNGVVSSSAQLFRLKVMPVDVTYVQGEYLDSYRWLLARVSSYGYTDLISVAPFSGDQSEWVTIPSGTGFIFRFEYFAS